MKKCQKLDFRFFAHLKVSTAHLRSLQKLYKQFVQMLWSFFFFEYLFHKTSDIEIEDIELKFSGSH